MEKLVTCDVMHGDICYIENHCPSYNISNDNDLCHGLRVCFSDLGVRMRVELMFGLGMGVGVALAYTVVRGTLPQSMPYTSVVQAFYSNNGASFYVFQLKNVYILSEQVPKFIRGTRSVY